MTIGGRRRPGSRGAGWPRAGGADVKELRIIPDQLLSGVRDMSAQGGEEIESILQKFVHFHRQGIPAADSPDSPGTDPGFCLLRLYVERNTIIV